MQVRIEVLTLLDGYHQEELEDKIKQLLKEYGVEAKIKSSTGNEMTVCKHLMTISEEDVWAIAEQEGIRIPEDKKDDVIYTVKKYLEGYCYDGAYNIWDAIKDAIKTALEEE
jgi:formaldehyde-activating enzyme involved in methanogenesis